MGGSADYREGYVNSSWRSPRTLPEQCRDAGGRAGAIGSLRNLGQRGGKAIVILASRESERISATAGGSAVLLRRAEGNECERQQFL